MHPALILLPALGLVLVPRVWVASVLKRHDVAEDCADSGHEVARRLLDRHGLDAVRVEPTDAGDHYDPRARAVRLARRNFDRKSLTAVTTAAHEVAHALQHASAYAPFTLRMQLARLADVTGKIGGVMLIAFPLTYLVTRQPVPRAAIGGAALGMIGTSSAAQLAALPTELDASFARAMPMLRDGQIRADQVADARRILVACSLTYVAASFSSVIHVWPWLGGGRVALQAPRAAAGDRGSSARQVVEGPAATRQTRAVRPRSRSGRTKPGWEQALRAVGKPLIRRWLAARQA